MGYELEGRMAEVCTCKTFCPCMAGMEPDGGVCEFNWVFHIDRGTINGVDVSGLNLTVIGHLDGAPGVPGTVRAAIFVDDTSDEAQHQVLLAAWTGQAGGPLAELAALVGEVVTVEREPIEFDVNKGSGRFRTGDLARAEIDALRGPSGDPTTLADFPLSPVLGSPAYPGLPTSFELNAAQYGFDFTPNSSEQFEFRYVAA